MQEFYVDMQFTYVNLEGLWYHNQVYGTLRRKVLARIVYMSSTERDFGMCIGFQKFDVQFWSLYFLLVSLFWLTKNMHYLHVSYLRAHFISSYHIGNNEVQFKRTSHYLNFCASIKSLDQSFHFFQIKN